MTHPDLITIRDGLSAYCAAKACEARLQGSDPAVASWNLGGVSKAVELATWREWEREARRLADL